MVRFHARNKLNIMKSTKITSQIAAILIKPHINNMHQRILKALENIKTGTFRQIAIETELEPDQVWKRMSELEKKGYVDGTDITICQKTNRPVTLWKIKETIFNN